MAEPAFSTDGRYVFFSQDITPGARWQYNKDSTGQVFVHQVGEPVVMEPLVEVSQLVDDDKLRAMAVPLDQFEIEPNAERADIAGAPSGLHSLDPVLRYS